MPHINTPVFEYWQEESVPFKEKNVYVSGGLNVLQAQAVCPFQAFARYRLRAQGLGSAQSGLNAAQRGQLVHAALDFFWQAVESQETLLRLPDAQYQQHLISAIDLALTELDHQTYTRTQLEIEKRRLHILLHEWLAQEKMRPAFKVLAREHKIAIELSGLRLKARIDRIDQLENGEILLIDYKTGFVDTPAWLELRPRPIQLPLYAISYPQAAGVVFAQVKAQAIKWVGLGAQAHAMGVQLPNDMQWSELLQHWQQTIGQIADEFYQGHAAALPLEGEKTCRYCDLELLCRIRSDV